MTELAFIAVSFSIGAVSAVLYAVFKVMRLNFKPSGLRTFVLDFLFVTLTFAALYFAVLFIRDGVFRLYMFISVFIGFLLVRSTFNRFFYPKIENLIVRLNKKIKTAKDNIVEKKLSDKKLPK